VTTIAGGGGTSQDADRAPRPARTTHGFATEWCIDDGGLDTSSDSTSESEGRLPAPSAIMDRRQDVRRGESCSPR